MNACAPRGLGAPAHLAQLAGRVRRARRWPLPLPPPPLPLLQFMGALLATLLVDIASGTTRETPRRDVRCEKEPCETELAFHSRDVSRSMGAPRVCATNVAPAVCAPTPDCTFHGNRVHQWAALRKLADESAGVCVQEACMQEPRRHAASAASPLIVGGWRATPEDRPMRSMMGPTSTPGRMLAWAVG